VLQHKIIVVVSSLKNECGIKRKEKKIKERRGARTSK
jgi:hypothetical protein